MLLLDTRIAAACLLAAANCEGATCTLDASFSRHTASSCAQISRPYGKKSTIIGGIQNDVLDVELLEGQDGAEGAVYKTTNQGNTNMGLGYSLTNCVRTQTGNGKTVPKVYGEWGIDNTDVVGGAAGTSVDGTWGPGNDFCFCVQNIKAGADLHLVCGDRAGETAAGVSVQPLCSHLCTAVCVAGQPQALLLHLRI